MKASAIKWPSITIGEHKDLAVRWTFYARWLLSKRQVDIVKLKIYMAEKNAILVDVMVEVFAAAVAENFKHEGKEVPDADYWALLVSQQDDPDADFIRMNKIIWEAIAASTGKTLPAVSPATPQETAKPEITQ